MLRYRQYSSHCRPIRQSQRRGCNLSDHRVRHAIRAKHYSLRTEQTYVEWIKRYVLHHGKRHPSDLGAAGIESFLTHTAVEGRVAAATQNQAKAALLFLYREVLGIELPWLDGIVRARMPVRLPTVFTEAEVAAILAELHGVNRLIGQLLYGAGLRIMEPSGSASSTSTCSAASS